MKQLQFEVWKTCNSRCTFCYLDKTNLYTSNSKKLENLNKIINIVSDIQIYKIYDTIALIGGEFFQGQLNTEEIKTKFFELIDLLVKMSNLGYIKTIWISATLTLGLQEDLYNTLNKLDKGKAEYWILTSYDTIGRFHTKKMFETWEYHINKIHTDYPRCNLNTTMILTGDLITKYLNESFSFNTFQKKYNTSLFLKLGAIPDNTYKSKQEMNDKVTNFFPKRKDFLNFLKKIKIENSLLYEKLFNIKYRADTLYCEYKDKEFVSERNKETKMESYDSTVDYIMDCGHLSLYKIYIDSDKCALCDKLSIERLEN